MVSGWGGLEGGSMGEGFTGGRGMLGFWAGICQEDFGGLGRGNVGGSFARAALARILRTRDLRGDVCVVSALPC